MTIQPEIRFRCDRCFDEISVSLNDQPAQERNKPPEGWMVLWVNETVTPSIHFCPGCKKAFDRMISEKS